VPHVSPRRALLKLICCALPLLAAAPAHAATACSYPTATPVFRPWLDTALYTPFPGSTFEQGATGGWASGVGTGVVTGDGNRLLAAGTRSLQVAGGSSATSPWMCVNATTPSMRFFVRRVSGAGRLTVKGVLKAPDGRTTSVYATMTAGSGWAPGPVVLFPPAVMTILLAGDYKAQFVFVVDAGTTYRIDDVQLDPYKGH
jgi:hypothetical protein